MRILYVASDIALAETNGGAIHVREVANGLAALGHEVRAIVRRGAGEAERGREHGFEVRRVLHRLAPRTFRLLALPAVAREARDFRPDVVIERYYNFGGEGVIVARRLSVPVVLEVNSPMIEYPGSSKQRFDRLVGSPLRRWREHLARQASAFVTPTAAILPDFVADGSVHELAWGANTERFHPGVTAAPLAASAGRSVVAFVSSFRAWHGAASLVAAAAQLERPDVLFLMIGDGPERRAIESQVAALGLERSFLFLGSMAHERVPRYLRLACVAVAPFETRRHRYLEIDFYWSPLKVLEYMAMGLPVVTIDLPALRRIVRPGVDGLVYPEGDAAALAAALGTLLDSPGQAQAFGRSARARAVEEYSWRGHCAALDAILRSL
jgi:alpha-maltose-1-phosphate synthase